MCLRHFFLILKRTRSFCFPFMTRFGWYDRVPQDTVLNPGKLRTLKWIPGDAIPQLNDLKVSEEEEHETEVELETLYLCSFEGCGRVFTEMPALRKHLHIHGEKQYICHHNGCGKVSLLLVWSSFRED